MILMKGYRDDALFGEGITDPLEVAFYETQMLGNSDIPLTLLNTDLGKESRAFMKEIVDDEVDEIDKERFIEIVKSYIGNRNFCLWLCANPQDVYESYVKPFSANDEIFPSFEDYKDNITEYEIPDDAIILADLGAEGALYTWCA